MPYVEFKSSGVKNPGLTIISAVRSLLAGVSVKAGTALTTILVWDNKDGLAQGTVLFAAELDTVSTGRPFMLTVPIRAETGLTLQLIGSGAQALVYYRED